VGERMIVQGTCRWGQGRVLVIHEEPNVGRGSLAWNLAQPAGRVLWCDADRTADRHAGWLDDAREHPDDVLLLRVEPRKVMSALRKAVPLIDAATVVVDPIEGATTSEDPLLVFSALVQLRAMCMATGRWLICTTLTPWGSWSSSLLAGVADGVIVRSTP